MNRFPDGDIAIFIALFFAQYHATQGRRFRISHDRKGFLRNAQWLRMVPGLVNRT